jgi:hypothetical protein
VWLFVVSAAHSFPLQFKGRAAALTPARGFGRRTFWGLDTTDGLSSCERKRAETTPFSAGGGCFISGGRVQFDFSLARFPLFRYLEPLCVCVLPRGDLLPFPFAYKAAQVIPGAPQIIKPRDETEKKCVSFVVCADCKYKT